MIDAGLSDGVRETLATFLGPRPASVLDVGGGTLVARGRALRAAAEALPFPDAVFDRVVCINALHRFADRARFFAEARRVLRPGGGLLTVSMDPHAERDEFAAGYAAEMGIGDRERFARVRTLRGEMAVAGFAWTESMEADHIEVVRPAADAPDELRLVADYRLYATFGWVAS